MTEDYYYDDFDEEADDLTAGYTPEEVGRIRLGRMFRRAMRGGLPRGRRSKHGRRRQQVRVPSPAQLALSIPRPSSSTVPVTRGNVITPGNQRVRQLGFPGITLAPGASGQLQARVLKAIQAQRLIISSSGTVLDNISVDNIRVGVDSQLAGTGQLPATMFERDAIGSEVQWNPAQTGTDITIDVTNNDAVNPATVFAGIYGVGAD